MLIGGRRATVVRSARRSRAREFAATLPRIPVALVSLFAIVALFGPLVAPHSAIEVNLISSNKPPAFIDGGVDPYVLGTDQQGRDILSRVIVGSRTSLSIAALAIVVGGTVGTLFGLFAGYLGRWVDAVAMRLVDLTLAFPSMLLALLLSVTVGPSYWTVVAVLAFILWARYARMVRGEALALREREFIVSAKAVGAPTSRIVLRHVLPNLISNVLVLSTLQVGYVVITEASLSFLGAGVPPPTPTWGGMVAEGRDFIRTSWWISLFPGLAIALAVLAFNMVGDWLRDALDPRLQVL